MAQVRLEVAEEEMGRIAQGQAPIHEVSPSTFLQLGLDLEEQQRVV